MNHLIRLAAKPALVLGMLTASAAAHAYIGPGMATGAIATVLGVLAGIAMLVVGAVWYPIKRLIQRIRRKS